MSVTDAQTARDTALHRILEIGEDQIPAQIRVMRSEKTLSKLMIDINAGLISDNEEERARAQAALDRMGFL